LILKYNHARKKTTKGLKYCLRVANMQTVALAIVVTGRYVLQLKTKNVKKNSFKGE